MILLDMWAELAGIYVGSLLLFLGQRLPLYGLNAHVPRPVRRGQLLWVLALGTVVDRHRDRQERHARRPPNL
jgi:hypothetical protein